MQIHELNTKALTSPAWVPFDDGSDTYKADFKTIIDDAVAEAFSAADVSGGVVEYESEDGEPLSGAEWSPFDLFEGGENLAALFTLVSEMAYNVRWLKLQNTKTTGTITYGQNVTKNTSFLNRCAKYGQVVHLSCAITANANISSQTTLLTIPEGFRPSSEIRFISYYTDGTIKMGLRSNGTLVPLNTISANKGIIINTSFIL